MTKQEKTNTLTQIIIPVFNLHYHPLEANTHTHTHTQQMWSLSLGFIPKILFSPLFISFTFSRSLLLLVLYRTGAIWALPEQEIGPGNERFTMHTHTHTQLVCYTKDRGSYEVTVLNIRGRVTAKTTQNGYSPKIKQIRWKHKNDSLLHVTVTSRSYFQTLFFNHLTLFWYSTPTFHNPINSRNPSLIFSCFIRKILHIALFA